MNSKPTMNCKFCRDAGKPRSQYTNHWVKDRPGGKVVCPTLLNNICRNCNQKGHTPKHCPNQKNSRMMEQRRIRLKYNDDDYAKILGVKEFCRSQPISEEINSTILDQDEIVISPHDLKKLLQCWKGNHTVQRHLRDGGGCFAWVVLQEVETNQDHPATSEDDSSCEEFAPNNCFDDFA